VNTKFNGNSSTGSEVIGNQIVDTHTHRK